MRNVFVIISVLMILGSCSSPLQTEQRIQNVGMLLNGNISDHVWNE
ncbi:hypothetical protein [Virgibacillus chiguensis]|nr:hypothetical protein [Virgibacillus chiguensis]